MRYLIVTGQSGAGKTACVHFLEDRGCFCMDNLPPVILPGMMETFDQHPMKQQHVAIGMDVRSAEFFDADAVLGMLAQLRETGRDIEIIFMEASDECLLSRYKGSRREHPLCQEGLTLMQAITEERVRLQPLREAATYVVDTTGLKTKDLTALLNKKLRQLEEGISPLRAEVMSFGFKRGLPRQADMVLDVRFLPNPFYIEELCRHSGLENCVRDFVLDQPDTQLFLEKWKDMLRFLLPKYHEEGRHRLVIAVGCTGGMHRSVVIAEALGAFLREQGLPTDVLHRDLLLEQARFQAPAGESET